ncbi:Rh214 [macacine betaherpesvirus 3]|nr:Rh214 [macacine betaherpesvirus 3]
MNSSQHNISVFLSIGAGPVITGYTCVFLFGILGHFYLYWKNHQRRHRTNSFSDVLFRHLMITEKVFTLTVPVWAYHLTTHGNLPGSWCRSLTFVFYLTVFARAFFYLLLIWDRYSVIICRHPLPVNLNYSQVIGLSVWLVAVLSASPFSIFNGSVKQCLGNMGSIPSESSAVLNLEVHLCSFWLPLIMSANCYYQAKRRASPDQLHELYRCSLLITIITTYAIVWFPFHLALLIDALISISHVEPSSALHWASIVVTCKSFTFVYAGISPLVYFTCCPTVRRELLMSLRPFFTWISGKTRRGYAPIKTQPLNIPDEPIDNKSPHLLNE